MADAVRLTIDGMPVTVPAGTLLVEAAKAIDVDVPVYCYHPKLGPAGLCRICLVEIEKMPKLQIACNTPVSEGMVVHTRGGKVDDGRRAVMEFLLLNHPLDCPICDKGGECDLQDFSMAYGQGASRLADPKSAKPKALDLGPTIVLDDERCIVCQRCSRFDDIVTRERSLVVKDRGQRDVIATASGEPYRSNFSGNVTELCPVGALTSKTYRFKSRPWDNERTETSCTQCSVGCRAYVDERYGTIARIMSVPDDDAVSDGWLCDRGRYNIGCYGDSRRLTAPLLRRGDEYVQIAWDDAIELWGRNVGDAIRAGGPQTVAVLGGGRLLNEELALLGAAMRGLGVTQLDWRAGRQRQATPGRHAGGYADVERAELIVAVGRPPSQTAPVLDLRIRKAVSLRGARYVTWGVHAAGSFVPSGAAASLEEVDALARDAARIALIWDGIDLDVGTRLGTMLDAWSARGTSVSAYIPGETNNARGAEAFGLLPGGDARSDVIAQCEAGSVRALSIVGANPILSHPAGGARLRAALARVPFIVASDLFLTETAQLAHLVLPARAGLEKTGHVCDLVGDVLALRTAHVAPEGTLSDGDMIVALGAELGLELPSPDRLAGMAATPPASRAHTLGDGMYRSAFERPAGGVQNETKGIRVAVAGDIFAGGGTAAFDAPLEPLRPVPSATFAPQTAARLGIRAGDRVDVRGGDDAALYGLTARVDQHAVEGVVSLIDGLPQAPANDFADGDLVGVVSRDVGSVAGVQEIPA